MALVEAHECGRRPHLRIQSAPSQPAGGSRTVPQPIQHPGLSSSKESYGKGSTEDPLHALYRHCNTHKHTIEILYHSVRVSTKQLNTFHSLAEFEPFFNRINNLFLL